MDIFMQPLLDVRCRERLGDLCSSFTVAEMQTVQTLLDCSTHPQPPFYPTVVAIEQVATQPFARFWHVCTLVVAEQNAIMASQQLRHTFYTTFLCSIIFKVSNVCDVDSIILSFIRSGNVFFHSATLCKGWFP